ncbi:MAG: molecular chaperone DnaJ, partial [Ruminococcaceae bacterium]|nr:molecular chaperone DnaJ [Oscillospiraceae bacterium]
MTNPYQVLGVSPNATDAEVKAAYRELAKKYHPDNYANNPLADLAQEKMQEINDAYDAIMKERRQGGASGAGGQSAGGRTYQGGQSRYMDIRRLINAGRIYDAQTLLDGIPQGERDAEWHFLKGSVLYRKGWLDDAYTCFVTAYRLDPQNAEYRAAVAQMEQNRRGGYATSSGGCDICDLCT